MFNPVAQYNQKFPTPEQPIHFNSSPQKHNGGCGTWGYQEALDRAREIISIGGLEVLGEKDAHGNHIFMLKRCIFNPEHKNNDAAIMVGHDGMLKYKCFHNSCQDKGWKDVKELFVGVSSVSKCKQQSASVSNNQQQSALESVGQQRSSSISKSRQAASCKQDADVTKPVSMQIKEFVEQGAGIFTTFEIDSELCLRTRQEKNARSRALNNLKKQGVIVPVTGRRGQWRTLDKECKGMKLNNKRMQSLPNLLPLGLHELCDMRTGNICIVAGSSNAGKSAYVSTYIRLLYNNNIYGAPVSNYEESTAAKMAEHICPGQKLECHFFSSEAGEDEMSFRLNLHPGGIDAFKHVNFWERDQNFADVIRPNAINVIDFLEVYNDFFLIGSWINDIHRVLDKGIAIIVIQKKRGSDVGKGGDVTMEKARLYVSLENNAPYGGICKVIKAKFPKQLDKNPNGLSIDYKLVDGCEFRPRGDWRYIEDDQHRKKINREYEAEGSQKNYMFNFQMIDGDTKGLNKKDVESWTASFPRIYVIGELEKIEKDSRHRPFLDSKSWFHTVSGLLNKRNTAVA